MVSCHGGIRYSVCSLLRKYMQCEKFFEKLDFLYSMVHSNNMYGYPSQKELVVVVFGGGIELGVLLSLP